MRRQEQTLATRTPVSLKECFTDKNNSYIAKLLAPDTILEKFHYRRLTNIIAFRKANNFSSQISAYKQTPHARRKKCNFQEQLLRMIRQQALHIRQQCNRI